MYFKWLLSNRKDGPKNPPETADKTPDEAKKGPTPPPDHPWDNDDDGKKDDDEKKDDDPKDDDGKKDDNEATNNP